MILSTSIALDDEDNDILDTLFANEGVDGSVFILSDFVLLLILSIFSMIAMTKASPFYLFQ